MYAYIKGELTSATPSAAVVEAGGIGYQIYIPADLFSKLPQCGATVLFYTSFVVREHSHTLYGFLSSTGKDLFEGLLGITGVGPKVALNLIGHLPPSRLLRAVCDDDLLTISKVPGIGKKTAERLIVEMRSKKTQLFAGVTADSAVDLSPNAHSVRDALNVLINLGYPNQLAQKALDLAVKNLPDHADVADLITEALKHNG